MLKDISCLLLTVYCLLIFSSCGNNTSSDGKSKTPSPGQTLYETNCFSCHGADGKLCVLGAKDLSVSTMSKEQMTEIITNGKSTMTPFANSMTVDEIGAVADYVQTLRTQ